ncbi:acyltransferase family protein [Rosistilla carotiformis]|uniref:acyltransferase family protein n=1 Tax=Rosistilla carotiformis TaxID=2528017 RepID=UPI00119F7EFE|nr:acyltransferase family protein [Rosistilla carotiformis]
MTQGRFRLFLAFVVVIHHSFPLLVWARAVGMFFVLSGCWISRLWRLSYSRKPSPYRTFLINRWWRIAPLFVTVQVIAVCLAWAGFWVTKTTAISDWRWWVTQPTVIGSTQFGRLLPPSWSLDVEMQFYLVAPIILMVAALFVGPRQADFDSSPNEND